MSDPISFRKELEILINRHSMEGGSNTPDFILAEFFADVLTVFDRTVQAREKWYGREPEPEVREAALADEPQSAPNEEIDAELDANEGHRTALEIAGYL